jgi:hypothetical protein
MAGVRIFASCLLALMPALASAQQPAATLADLRTRLRIGESIQVVDRRGMSTEGAFDGLSNASLRLIVGGERREFPDGEIQQVRRRRSESKWDGMLIGAGAGIAAGLLWTRAECGNDTECAFYTRLVGVPVFGAAGLGGGALIDFAIRRYDTIYAGSTTTGLMLRVSPLLAVRGSGVQITASF